MNYSNNKKRRRSRSRSRSRDRSAQGGSDQARHSQQEERNSYQHRNRRDRDRRRARDDRYERNNYDNNQHRDGRGDRRYGMPQQPIPPPNAAGGFQQLMEAPPVWNPFMFGAGLLGQAPVYPFVANPLGPPINPFQLLQQQRYQQPQPFPENEQHDFRGRGGWSNSSRHNDGAREMHHRSDFPRSHNQDRVSRGGGGEDYFHSQEQQRVRASQTNKTFLEDVHLPSDFAFRLDTSSNPGQVNHYSISHNQKSSYEGGVGNGIFGASKDEISRVYNKFHTFRCIRPEDVDDEESDVEAEKTKRDKAATIAKNFISLGEDNKNKHKTEGYRARADASEDLDFSFEKKDEVNIRDKIEYYNKQVRIEPQNVSLWIEFVHFQDKVSEESAKNFNQEDENEQPDSERRGNRKAKRNRKYLLEKKISILEKALESNPKNIQLHLLRLNYLLEVSKPRHVLTEWKKLVTQHQQIAPFWNEYLLFSASQLMVYSTKSNIGVFESCFLKFRLMMNPQYPDFQRPRKFLLFTSDILFGLGLLLKNAGFMERAVALCQAQLELDFYCPRTSSQPECAPSSSTRDEMKIFESFWDAGPPVFGEPGAKGWLNFSQDAPMELEEGLPSASVSDVAISELEEEIVDTINSKFRDDAESKLSEKVNLWVNMESCRSKLYWLPWKSSSSDAEDCDDINRVVTASALTNFISLTSTDEQFISQFDKQALHFRHVVSFLMTLREDFIPHTQSVDSAFSPFLNLSLTESTSLFSEIYYWRRLADLYVGTDNSEPESKSSHHVFAPEGFKIIDLVTANVSSKLLAPTLFSLSLVTQQDDVAKPVQEIQENRRLSMLEENNQKFMEMFKRVVETSIDLLEPEFASTLLEMFLRFEQKLTCGQSGSRKDSFKFAKGLLKKEKLRSCVGAYRELAMLEYFRSGDVQKAIDVLIKSINATVKSSSFQDWDTVDWEAQWKLVVDLTSLYRQLSELYLQQGNAINDSKAYYTLVQLGNCFQALEPESLEFDDLGRWKPKTNDLLRAAKSFDKILTMLIPTCRSGESTASKSEKESKVSVTDASEIYDKWNGDKCVEFLLQQRNLIAEWTCCFALFQFFCNGFDSSCQIFEQVLDGINIGGLHKRVDQYSPGLIRFHIKEQLYINWCNLAGRCLIKDPLMNSKFRNILAMALDEFPSSPPLLLLFIDVENQTSVAGKLWRLMMANMKPDSDKFISHWPPLIMGIGLARKIEELEHDEEVGLPCFGLGGPAVPQDTIFYKLDSMISVAEQNPGARHCPLLWRTHLKLLAIRAREGKDVQRARATFYEAIRHCPSSKAIYLDGVTYFPDLLQEVNDLLVEKELLIRLPLQELDLLLELEERGNENEGNAEDVSNAESNENEPEPEGNRPDNVVLSDGEVDDSE